MLTRRRRGDAADPVAEPSGLTVRSDTLVTDGSGLAIEPVVADDSAHRRCGTRQHGRVANRGHRWIVLEIGIREDGAVGEEPLDPVGVSDLNRVR